MWTLVLNPNPLKLGNATHPSHRHDAGGPSPPLLTRPHLISSVGESCVLGVDQHSVGLCLHPVEGGRLHRYVGGLQVAAEHLGRHHVLEEQNEKESHPDIKPYRQRIAPTFGRRSTVSKIGDQQCFIFT